MPKSSIWDPSRPGVSVAVAPPLTAAIMLFLGALLTYYTAINFADLNGAILFLAVAICLFCVGVFAVSVHFHVKAKSNRILGVFDAIFARDVDPAFVTDRYGMVRLRNAAANKIEDAGRTVDAQSILAQFSADAPSVVYRGLLALQDTGRFEEYVEHHDGSNWRVEALSHDASDVIWSVRPVLQTAGPTPAAHELEGLGFLISSVDGDLVHANDTVRNLPDDVVSKLTNTTIGDDCERYKSQDLRSTDGVIIRRISSSRSDGTIETVVFPIDEEDLTQAGPDQVLDALPVALARISEGGCLIYANEAARQLLGENAVAGTRLDTLMEGLGRSINDRINDTMNGRSHMKSEVARAKVQGQEIFLQVTMKRLKLAGEASLLAVINDATELKTLEAQFVQSQKMQAVGQLAGGVAHDFNNLLTAINGHCDLILMRHEPTNTDYGDLIQIRHNANRAASLVGQLLAFSRKQTLLPKVIDLYDTLSDLNHLLNRLLGEKVSLKIEHADDLAKVRVDKRQLEQVIMNLVVNARDAMPNGGEVAIHTKTVIFEKDFERDRAVVPFGQYVQIDVSDTGMGIPQDKIAKIFEPFFTTKRVGEGTGLGLSTAYGIIKQTGGFIFAESEVGAGTTFTIYLPALANEEGAAVPTEVEPAQPTDLTGRGVVLLVEDEVPVRSFAARALGIRGYTVIEAASAEEALDILEDDNLHVDIFVSDVIMPGMDGPTWVRMAQEKRPDTKVVFVSGYAEDAFEGGQMEVPNATFLPKPFSLNELTHTVKEQIGDLVQ